MRFFRVSLLATAAVAGAVAIAACGGSSNTSDQTGGGASTVTVTRTVTQPATPSTTTTAPLTPTTATKTTTTAHAPGTACNASDLTPSYLGSNGAAGTVVLGFSLRNTGSFTCHTYGWPGVEFLSAGGTALATNATRTTADVVGSTPAEVLTLKPGEEASFRMVASDVGSGGGSCPTATGLQIYAPDDTVTMKVSLPGVAACGRATVSPLMPGASAFAGQGGGGQASGASSGSGGASSSGGANSSGGASVSG